MKMDKVASSQNDEFYIKRGGVITKSWLFFSVLLSSTHD